MPDDNLKARFRLVADPPIKPTAAVVPFRPSCAPEKQPTKMSAPEALKIVRFLARDSARVVVVAHANVSGSAISRGRKSNDAFKEERLQKGLT